MLVKEFLQSLDRNELVLSYMSCEDFYDALRRNHPNEPVEDLLALTLKAQKNLGKFLAELMTLEPAPNKEGNVIFSVKRLDERQLDSFTICRKDIESLNPQYEHYAYEFESWENILGWDISEACRYAVGEYPYACSILYEMSFFGYTRETQKSAAEEVLGSIAESTESIEKESAEARSWEETKNDLGFLDTRLEAEKAFDEATAKIGSSTYRNSYQDYMQQLFQLENSYQNK